MELLNFFKNFCGPQIPWSAIYQQGLGDAASCKECIPPDHDLIRQTYLDGYRFGEIKGKATRGELIQYICEETRCKSCGSHNYGMRMGCRCGGEIEWGVRIQRAEESEYMSATEAETVLRGKRPVFDWQGNRLIVRKTKNGLTLKKRPPRPREADREE